MEKSNLAFITALYNAKKADFYTDIYFPVVKFAAMELFYSSAKEYYEVMSLQEGIKAKTGLTIPLLVLKNCIRSFSTSHNNDVSLVLYENGNYFKIERAWDSTVTTDIENRTDEVARQFRELELVFQQYLHIEKLDCNYTFVDFFTQYAEEAYSLIGQKEQPRAIDGEFVNLIRFVEYVKQNEQDIYQVILDLMWSSIISGFLQRPRTEVGTKYVEKVEYYLDTALVLNILGLNANENVSYARDLLRIIKEAGGIPKVHPITMQEISQIFTQIEYNQGPRPGTAIQIAWERDSLTTSKLVHLRNNLTSTLRDNYGITTFNISQGELEKIINKYKNNSLVCKLAEERFSLKDDYFREIHDVFMHDFVEKQNENSDFIEKKKAYFITINMGLIDLYKDETTTSSVLHAGKVVMSLWIHGSRSVDIKKSILVEVMSRCFAMNQTDARHKINTFSKHYKDNDLTVEDMQSMYTSLIRRSAETINKFDEIEKNDKSESPDESLNTQFTKAIVILVRNEKNERDKSETAQKELVDELNSSIDELRKQLDLLQKTSDSQRATIYDYLEKLKKGDEEIKGLKEEIEKRKEIEIINDQLEQKGIILQTLEEQRENAVNNRKYYFVVIVEIIIVLIFVVFLVLAVVKLIQKDLKNVTGLSLLAIVPLLTFLLRIKDLYLCDKVKKSQLRESQYELWDMEHPEYGNVKSEIKTLEDKKQSLGGYRM